jgi:hypothetical protein
MQMDDRPRWSTAVQVEVVRARAREADPGTGRSRSPESVSGVPPSNDACILLVEMFEQDDRNPRTSRFLSVFCELYPPM